MAIAFFAELDVPEVDLVHTVDVLSKQVRVGIFVDGGFVVACFELADEVKEIVNLGVHNAEVANDADLVDSKSAFVE